MKTKFWSRLTIVLAVLQVMLILMSWIVSSAAPQSLVRSLLGSEGIRWFMGRFAENIATPYLAWLLLLSIAYGTLRTSGLHLTLSAVFHGETVPYRKRFSLFVAALLLVLFVIVMVYLTCAPHAILLSATGRLFPGSFGSALVPVVAFAVTTISITFGLLSGRYQSWHEAFLGMTYGIRYTLPLWVVYVFAAQLLCSIAYVFVIPPTTSLFSMVVSVLFTLAFSLPKRYDKESWK